jgi:membrane-bound lytic murein transglycosylase F
MTARRLIALLAIPACLAVGCEEAARPVPPIEQSGELVVLTVNGPATYFEDAQGLPSGFEYDLVTLFARELGVKAVWTVTDNPANVDRLLRELDLEAGSAAREVARTAVPRRRDVVLDRIASRRRGPAWEPGE